MTLRALSKVDSERKGELTSSAIAADPEALPETVATAVQKTAGVTSLRELKEHVEFVEVCESEWVGVGSESLLRGLDSSTDGGKRRKKGFGDEK